MPMIPQGNGGNGAPPVTMYTQAAIQALHDAIAHEPDAEDKAALAQCLQQILKVQAKNAAQGGGAAQSPLQAAGGGFPQPDTGAAQQGPPPELMQALAQAPPGMGPPEGGPPPELMQALAQRLGG
jgi:hypothetical protein